MLFLDRCCEDERKIKHFHPTKYKFLSRLLCSGKNRIFLSKINSKKKKKLLSSLLMDLKREDGMGGRGEVVSYRRFFSWRRISPSGNRSSWCPDEHLRPTSSGCQLLSEITRSSSPFSIRNPDPRFVSLLLCVVTGRATGGRERERGEMRTLSLL